MNKLQELDLTKLKEAVNQRDYVETMLAIQALEMTLIKNELVASYDYHLSCIWDDTDYKKTHELISVAYHSNQLAPMVINYGYEKINQAIKELGGIYEKGDKE